MSEPESVDGYLGVMVGDSLWGTLLDESMLATATDFVVSIVGDNAKHAVGYGERELKLVRSVPLAREIGPEEK